MIARKQALAALWLGLAGISGIFGIAGPAGAQDLVFSMEATDSCLAAAGEAGEGRACIGLSARRCMEASDGGETTVGMGVCLGRELEEWDRRLNAHYRALMARERREDEEMRRIGASAPQRAPALRAMQRAWIAFRDARCDYVAAQWGGGTGAGPAGPECRMRMTAEQALFLRRMLEEG